MITISRSDLMQTHCIAYPHSHVNYTNALDHCVCMKYKVSRVHSVTRIRYPALSLYHRPFKLILNIDPCMSLHTVQDSLNSLECSFIGFEVSRQTNNNSTLLIMVNGLYLQSTSFRT